MCGMTVTGFECGPIGTNAWLVVDEGKGEALVVDAPHDVTPLVAAAATKGGFKIREVVDTHGHWDHVADNAALVRATGARLAIHGLDAGMLADGGVDGFSLPFAVAPSKADRELREGDLVEVGGLRLAVMHTPGHTPGGICLYLEEEGLVFTGDTLFDGTCGRVDLPGSSEEDMMKSLRRLAGMPAATRVYPGHGEATTIGRQGWLGKL